MKITATELPGVVLIEPQVFADARGAFMETWQLSRYRDAGIGPTFVQANLSRSRRGVVRGLHFQWPRPQGKLVQVIQGAVFDVAVDIRPQSATFKRWVGVELSAANGRQLYIPPGFAHGFQALTDDAVFHYLCTDVYWPAGDRVIAWNDPDLAIQWPLADAELSAKDAAAPRLMSLAESALPALVSADKPLDTDSVDPVLSAQDSG